MPAHNGIPKGLRETLPKQRTKRGPIGDRGDLGNPPAFESRTPADDSSGGFCNAFVLELPSQWREGEGGGGGDDRGRVGEFLCFLHQKATVLSSICLPHKASHVRNSVFNLFKSMLSFRKLM